MITFAPEGMVNYTTTQPAGPIGKQCSLLIFQQANAKISLNCNVPRDLADKIFFKVSFQFTVGLLTELLRIILTLGETDNSDQRGNFCMGNGL